VAAAASSDAGGKGGDVKHAGHFVTRADPMASMLTSGINRPGGEGFAQSIFNPGRQIGPR
jgi:hypothetical protein